MALYADVTHDSRVLREAATLAAAGHEVEIHCLSGTGPRDADFAVVAANPRDSAVLPDGRSPFLSASAGGRLAIVRRRVGWIVGYARSLRAFGRWAVAQAPSVDVWHAHDLTALLAVGPLVRPPTRIVYDSHEIFIETGTAARLPAILRRLLAALERRFARRAFALVTVNEGYAGVLERRIRPRRVVLVRNCPPTVPAVAREASPLRRGGGFDRDTPIVLYHGIFSPNRGIEQAAEAILQPGLERVHLAVVGFGALRADLFDLAAQPRFGGRVHVLDGVPPDELGAWVAGADVDVIALQRSSLNHWLCTPNKLWESIAAGVPVVVSDFPMMARIVNDPTGRLGAACDPGDPESIALAIRSIVDLPAAEQRELRSRCLAAARTRWNWESESARLVDLYSDIARQRLSGTSRPR